MADAIPAEPLETYGIVLIGAMNPRIHHPLWYQMHGLLDDAEVKACLDAPFVFTPQIAQFQTPAFTVTCISERWDITTTDREIRKRILDIAVAVFDEKLHETSISLFAFNNNLSSDIKAVDVRSELMRKIVVGGLELNTDGIESANVTIVRRFPSGDHTSIQIQPSLVSSSKLWVHSNSNHRIIDQTNPFILKPLFDLHFDNDLQFALDMSERIRGSLSLSKGVE